MGMCCELIRARVSAYVLFVECERPLPSFVFPTKGFENCIHKQKVILVPFPFLLNIFVPSAFPTLLFSPISLQQAHHQFFVFWLLQATLVSPFAFFQFPLSGSPHLQSTVACVKLEGKGFANFSRGRFNYSTKSTCYLCPPRLSSFHTKTRLVLFCSVVHVLRGTEQEGSSRYGISPQFIYGVLLVLNSLHYRVL